MKRIFFALVLLQSASVHSADAELDIGASVKYFYYEELDINGNSLNREAGFLPGVNATVKLAGALSQQFELQLHAGNVEYDGMTQSGAPHHTRTSQELIDAGYTVEFPVIASNAYYYAGLGYHFWKRDIQANNNINGLLESYWWWSAEAGLRYIHPTSANSAIEAKLGLLRTFNGSIEIDLTSYGYEKQVLNLGDDLGFTGGLRYTTQSHIGVINFIFKTTRWEFGRSNSKTISNGIDIINIVEPRSVSWHTSLGVELAIKF